MVSIDRKLICIETVDIRIYDLLPLFALILFVSDPFLKSGGGQVFFIRADPYISVDLRQQFVSFVRLLNIIIFKFPRRSLNKLVSIVVTSIEIRS